MVCDPDKYSNKKKGCPFETARFHLMFEFLAEQPDGHGQTCHNH